MIKSITDKENKPIEIDLTGPQGNAFPLLGLAKELAYQLDYTQEETDVLLTEMQSSNYEHLIRTLDNEFGEYIILYR